MIVTTVLGKIISIFIIMIVGVICYKVGIIDNNTKEKLSKLSTLIVNPILIFMSFQMKYDKALLKNMGILLYWQFAAMLFRFYWPIFYFIKKKAMIWLLKNLPLHIRTVGLSECR